MMLALSFLAIRSLVAAVSWSAPETVIASVESDIETPVVFFERDDLNEVEVVCVSKKADESSVVNNHFNGNIWTGVGTAFTTAEDLSSLTLGQDHTTSTRAIFWATGRDPNGKASPFSILGAQYGGGGIWVGSIALENFLADPQNLNLRTVVSQKGNPIATWQDENNRLTGLTFNEGSPSAPYFLSEEGQVVLESLVGPGLAIYGTEDSIFGTFFDPLAPTPDPSVKSLYPLSSNIFCLGVGKLQQNLMFLFEDKRSQFLISAQFIDGDPVFRLVDSNVSNRNNAALALDSLAKTGASSWETDDGKVYVSTYDGSSWTKPKILDSQGFSPNVFILPNNHVLVAWVSIDSSTGEQVIKVSEFNSATWSQPIPVSDTGVAISDPQIRSNDQGKAIVVWARRSTLSDKTAVEAAIGSF